MTGKSTRISIRKRDPSFWLVLKRWFCFNCWRLSSNFFYLNSTCPDLLFQHAWDIKTAPFDKMIFSVQPFPLSLFQSHFSSSDFLNLAHWGLFSKFRYSFQSFSSRMALQLFYLSALFHSHSFCSNIYAAAYINELSSVMLCVWILLTASLIFPTSAFTLVLSHDFGDGNPILFSSFIICRILPQRASISGLIYSCNSSAVKTLGSCRSPCWCSSWALGVAAWSCVYLVRRSVVSVSWCS